MRERILQALRDPKQAALITGVVAFGAGVGVGYILGRRETEVTIEEELDAQLAFDFDISEALMSDASKVVNVVPHVERRPFVIDAEMLEEVKKIHPSYEESDDILTDEELVEEQELVRHSVFANEADEGWNYEEELKNRSSDKPYILHKDEFYADEMNLHQITLCYYAQDDIMADEDDTPVYNYKVVTGDLNFGHGSGDPNVVYVRNEKRRAEYEILYHDASYAEEILGYEIQQEIDSEELKHSNNRKFREE